MQSRFRQLLTLACVGVTLGGCDAGRQFGPDADPALLASGGKSVAAVPSTLTSTPISFAEIQLAWKDNSTNEDGFDIHRSTTGAAGAYTAYTTAGAGTTSTSDYGVTASTQYCYKVRAFVTKGKKMTYSTFSNASCATTLALPVPSAPSNLSVRPAMNNTIEITWAADADPEYGFRVERSATSAGPWEIVSSVASTSRSAGDWSRIPEQNVCYQVIALNRHGGSAPSNVDCTVPPAAPSNVVATMVDSRTIDLAWQDNSSVEDGYEIRGYDASLAIRTFATLPAGAQSHRIQGLTSDMQYWFWVIALRDGGYSNNSSAVMGTTASAGPPSAPNVSAAPNGSTAVNVSWSATSPSTVSYRVERSSDHRLTWVQVGTATGTGFIDAGVAAEEELCYRAFGINGRNEESAASNVDCTTPPAAPTNVHIAWMYDDGFELMWTDNSAVEDGYEVWAYYYEWYCDDSGNNCGEYPVYYAYPLPPNSTSQVIMSWENVSGVVAVKDGGMSDNGLLTWSPPPASESQRIRSLPPGAQRRAAPRTDRPLTGKPDRR